MSGPLNQKDPLRSRSPVLRSFPWRHGCILHAGPLQPWVANHQPATVPTHISQVIQVSRLELSRDESESSPQSAARSIDLFDSKTLPTHPASEFVVEMLFPTNIPRDSSTNRDWSNNGIHTSFFGGMMLLYHTLDTLLWSYDWDPYPLLCAAPPRTSAPNNIGVNIRKVIKQIEDWPSIVNNIPFPRQGLSSTQDDDLRHSSDYEVTLRQFYRAISSDTQSSWDKICAHLYSAGFIIRWISQVRCPSIHSFPCLNSSQYHTSNDVLDDKGPKLQSLIRSVPLLKPVAYD